MSSCDNYLKLEIDKFYFMTVLLSDFFFDKREEYEMDIELFIEIGLILSKNTYTNAYDAYKYFTEETNIEILNE